MTKFWILNLNWIHWYAVNEGREKWIHINEVNTFNHGCSCNSTLMSTLTCKMLICISLLGHSYLDLYFILTCLCIEYCLEQLKRCFLLGQRHSVGHLMFINLADSELVLAHVLYTDAENINRLLCPFDMTLLLFYVIRCQPIFLHVFKWLASSWRRWKFCFMHGWRFVSFSFKQLMLLYLFSKLELIGVSHNPYVSSQNEIFLSWWVFLWKG